ncbi:MAG: lamin tail domain-containing protein [Verrucomicrobia bacterium]|nr:lamin tail domain-containing protein [Verrucomicrobiota bacterium]
MLTPCRILAALALIWQTSSFLTAQEVAFVPSGADWRVFRGRQDPSPGTSAGWTRRDFVDAAWPEEPATFYYGEAGLSGTELTDMSGNYSTLFLRRRFQITDPTKVSDLELRVICDDGFVAYLNGQRVATYSFGGTDPAFNSFATVNAPEPVGFQDYPLPSAASLLVAGENVLAIAVLNVSLASSDLVFDAELVGRDLTPSPPVVASVAPPPGLVTNLTQIKVTFSEPVVGVTAEHFLINGVPAASVTGQGAVYTFTFPRPTYGLVSVGWGVLHGIRDLETPPVPFAHTSPGAAWAYELLDPGGPTVVNRQPTPSSTLRQLGEVRLQFSRPVVGLDATDLLLNGQPAVSVSGLGAGPYTFRFSTPATAGTATLSWSANHGITSDEPEPHPFNASSWTYQVDPNRVLPRVVIQEILTDNQAGLKDEDEDPEDWIELWNQGPGSVNLAGWALTDGADAEDEWVFPSVEIPANGLLLVWASGKDRAGTGPRREWHTHFKLNSNGDRLRLLGPELPRPIQDEVEFGTQGADFSFGRTSEPTAPWRYFAVPTPRQPNGTSTITNQTAAVRFSVERGYYDSPFHLSLACETPGAVIRYTTNGSPPVAPEGFVYSGPIQISASRVIRAAAVAPNQLPSPVRTHTYLYGLPTSRRSLPALSLVTATNHLFGRNGIMESNPRNTTKRGPAWERPVSVEYFDPDGTDHFQVNAGLRLQGGDYIRGLYNYRVSSLPESKYSFRLYFRGEYGQGRLNHRLFPNTTVESFDTVVLRAGMNDHSNPFLKDEVVRQLSSNLGQPASHGTFVHLFLNGVYRGYYNPTERIDVDFLRAYHGGGEAWDIVAQMGEVREGDGSSWNALLNLAQTRPATNQANHLEFARRMDLTNFVDYLLPNIYVDADDWPHNNWRAASEATPDGLWRFYVWDAEWSFGQPNGHTTSFNTINNQLSTLSPPWGTTEIQRLFNALKRGREFQMLFSDRVHRAFFNDGPLTDARIRATYEETKVRLNTARTISGFANSTINSWINGRRRFVLSHLFTAGFNRSTNAPGLSPFGGAVPSGYSLVLTNVSGAIFYTVDGKDPREAFTEAVSPTARQYVTPIIVTQPFVLKARSREGTTNWSALTEAAFTVVQGGPALRFSELMYNPPGGDAFEFIELVNVSGVPVDLSGFSLDGVNFRFPAPTPLLAAGSRIVLANADDPGAFGIRYPQTTVSGYFTGSLNNGGETISLLDRDGQLIESVTYSDQDGWPTSADGGGRSLERIELEGDPDALASWRASPAVGGNPGQASSAPMLPLVRLNELSAQTAPEPDWIELRNAGATLANVSNWSLTDDPAQPRKFVFPNGTQIPAGGYLVVNCQPGAGGLRADFGLDAAGEQVVLFDTLTNVVDAVSFGSQAAGLALGRLGENRNWVLTEPSPGLANQVVPTAGAEGVRLNEFLADSDAGDDWIELHNPGTLPAALAGGQLVTSNAVFRISGPAFIGAGGFAVLKADENPGPDHVDFKLPAAGGKIEWRDAAGVTVDRVDYGLQTPSASLGRIPDGTGPWTALPGNQSPGASNYFAPLGTTLRLSELMAINQGASLAPDGLPADWLEVHNPQTNALSLAGMTVDIDQFSSPTLAAGLQVPAAGRLVLWATERTLPAGVPNLGRSLPDRGAVISLQGLDGRLLDRLRYGSQLINQSVGRPETNDVWGLLATPSPGNANGALASLGEVVSVRLNEWLVSVTNGFEWLELYNPSGQPVDLGGSFLTDDPSISGIGHYAFAPLTLIPVQGFLRLYASGDAEEGPDHLNFRLDRWGETLRLSSPLRTLIDQVNYPIQVPGVSEGRLPDGSSRIVALPDPTPLAPNGGLTTDLDGDGMPDVWEFAFGLNPDSAADASLDPDQDGFSNAEEYQTGTSPNDATSRLWAEAEMNAGITVRFTAQTDRTYSILYLDELTSEGVWKKLSDIPAGPIRAISVNDPEPPASPSGRWYRVVTPQRP